ncbi:MAG: DUF6682 family protein [Betaproteobacteria bacterium]
MTIAAQSIIRRVVETIQDNTSIRWPVAELVRYLNDGQREVVLYRPDSMVTNAPITLVSGAKQSLPANGAKLIDVVRNTEGTKRSVRMTSRSILDTQSPNWYDLTGVTEVLHYMYDPRDPRTFYVYPPAAASGASIEIVYAAYPTDITEPTDGALYTAVTGNISLPDIYGNVLADYILYRAYTKDSEYAGNVQRAQGHYAAFQAALTTEMNGTTGVAPKV